MSRPPGVGRWRALEDGTVSLTPSLVIALQTALDAMLFTIQGRIRPTVLRVAAVTAAQYNYSCSSSSPLSAAVQLVAMESS